jgi:POT family proton-dependent oligopeptide transporter
VPLVFAIWRWQARRGREPGDLGKIGLGAAMAAVANLLLVAACLIGGKASILWPLAYNLLLGVAFLYQWPTLLALVSRAAPARVKATLMGAVFLSLFVANTIIGRLGALYEQMSPAAFWGMHAAIGAAGAVLALALKGALRPLLEPQANQ